MRHYSPLLRDAVRRTELVAVFGQKEFKGYKDRSNLYDGEPAPAPAADVAPPKTDYKSEYQAMPKVEINLDDFFTQETPAEKEANAKASKAAEAKAARLEAQRLKEEEDTAKFEADKAARQSQVTPRKPRRRDANHPSLPLHAFLRLKSRPRPSHLKSHSGRLAPLAWTLLLSCTCMTHRSHAHPFRPPPAQTARLAEEQKAAKAAAAEAKAEEKERMIREKEEARAAKEAEKEAAKAAKAAMKSGGGAAVPAAEAPSLAMPSLPSFGGGMPSFSMPKIEVPNIEVPKIELPDAPSFSMPAATPEAAPSPPPAPPPAPAPKPPPAPKPVAPQVAVSGPEGKSSAQLTKDAETVISNGNSESASLLNAAQAESASVLKAAQSEASALISEANGKASAINSAAGRLVSEANGALGNAKSELGSLERKLAGVDAEIAAKQTELDKTFFLNFGKKGKARRNGGGGGDMRARGVGAGGRQ